MAKRTTPKATKGTRVLPVPKGTGPKGIVPVLKGAGSKGTALRSRTNKPAAKLAPVHPGEVLRHEFMEPLDLTAYRVAQDTGMPQSRIGAILRGRRAVSAQTAIHLASYFGTSPEFWLNLQTRHDLAIAEDEHGAAIRRSVKPAAE